MRLLIERVEARDLKLVPARMHDGSEGFEVVGLPPGHVCRARLHTRQVTVKFHDKVHTEYMFSGNYATTHNGRLVVEPNGVSGSSVSTRGSSKRRARQEAEDSFLEAVAKRANYLTMSEARVLVANALDEKYPTAYSAEWDVEDKPRVKPGLRTVRDEVFFWRARRPIAIGAKVPPFSGRLWQGNKHRLWLEDVFEEVRRKVNPGAPPRIGSVMVCPELGAGFCSGGFSGSDHVYAVRATGKAFTSDAEMWTEAVVQTSHGTYAMDMGKWKPTPFDEREARGWAREFWKGRAPSGFSNYGETLISGDVRVIARVDPKTGEVIE